VARDNRETAMKVRFLFAMLAVVCLPLTGAWAHVVRQELNNGMLILEDISPIPQKINCGSNPFCCGVIAENSDSFYLDRCP
jgi:hypothetical protein